MRRLPLLNDPISVLTKRAVLFLIPLLFSFYTYCQTTNISGVVNSYYQVTEIIPPKVGIRVASTLGLNPNDRVMIIQMKGASIITANNSTYGDTTSLNNVGNYEIGTICAIRSDTVFLFFNLLNQYTITDKVQLVKFGEYYSANVVDTIKALPWNNTNGTGGVIAIYADQDITLNAPVFADSSGYKGGAFLQHSINCISNFATGYVYDGNNINAFMSGAFKGEGVANVLSTQNGGRGAPANGGGGGNNHNNSGGGGANLTVGGIGGGNSSSMGCIGSIRGLAGKALSSWNGKKIFMGGGGGAGHNNNGVFTLGGGNGGGIIFIWTNNLIGNSQLITANGGNGGQSQADGAGGGGAGGTIIMHVTNYTGNLTVQANGGAGGVSNDGLNIGRCYGGGGGSSGGAIYFTGVTPPITVTADAGIAGAELARETSCAPAQPAAAGSNGQIISSYTFSRSTDPAGYCLFLLPSKLISFTGAIIEKKVRVSWRILNPELVRNFVVERRMPNNEWITIGTVDGRDMQENYFMTDNNPSPGYNLYRLKVTEKNNQFYYSENLLKYVDYNSDYFTVYPNPAINKITIDGKFNEPALLKILDVSGRIILQQRIVNTRTEISLPGLPAGIYLLRINEVVKKLIIQ